MKVVCDNCRAVYKVPDDKLTKAVNKATCRNCGHRMLIPRPKPNADPEERTLVTAVPPTPAGAPPRGGHDQPGQRSSGPDDLNMGTPMVAPRVDQTIPGPEEDFDEAPDTKLSVSNSERSREHRSHPAPSEQITAKDGQPGRSGARNVPSMPPDRGSSRSIPPSDRKRQTPAPSPMSAPIHGPPQGPPMQPPAPMAAGRRAPSTPPRGTPASPPRSVPPPGPRTGGYPAMALHDPAGDLNWALLGTSTALIGGFLLAFLSVWNHPLVMWFGLAMTFGGGLLTFMVLLTGGRGRRPAKTLLSLVLGFMVAIVMSSTMVATKWGAERVIDAYDIHFSNVGLTGGSSTPAMVAAAPGPSLGSVTQAEAPSLAGAAEARTPVPPPAVPGRSNDGVAAAEPARPPVAAPPPAPPAKAKSPAPVPVPVPPPAPPPKPGPTAKPVPPPPPAPAPAAPMPAPAPPPPPAPAPAADAGMATVPMNVIHVMVSNNLEVKKCFVPLFKAGTLPPRVDLKFNIMPSGTANSAQILQANFRGSELEGCLSRAVMGITFPPTTGTGTSITYPFVLQQ